MPVRCQKSSLGGILSLLAVGVLFGLSAVNYQLLRESISSRAFVTSINPDNRADDVSTPLNSYGMSLKANDPATGTQITQAEADRYFKWRIRQRGIYYADTDPTKLRFKEEIPNVPCLIGNPTITPTGVSVGTQLGICAQDNWSNAEMGFKDGQVINGQYSDARYLYVEVALLKCTEYTAAADVSTDCATDAEITAIFAGGVRFIVWCQDHTRRNRDRWDREPVRQIRRGR